MLISYSMKTIILSKKRLLIAIVITLMVAVLLSPSDYIMAVFGGLLIYVKNVLPALFPFIFFTKLLTMLGTSDAMSKGLARPCGALFATPPISAYVISMSIICGYPIGAKLAQEFYMRGELTTKDCEKLTATGNSVGPIFAIGTIGTLLMGNKLFGYIILASHLLGSMICGIIIRGKRSTTDLTILKPTSISDNADILNTTMCDSIISVLGVGGYIAMMSLVISFFEQIQLFNVIAEALSYTGINAVLTKSILVGLLEMTYGITSLTTGFLPTMITVPTATFLVTFGGLCIHLQSMNFLSKCGVRYSMFLAIKLLQAVIASSIACLFCLML